MCGFAGFLGPAGIDGDAMRALARSMAARLVHRGPDDEGTWIDAAAGIAFGFRRLSILDLSPAGAQPMVSASGRYVIVFNGEVYNHAELRRELPGIAFRGHSDTEVMLAAIDAWGVRRAVERFVGMFAFALWDRDERALSLVRDRAGVKPLFLARAGESVLFGSELKAITAHPRFDPAVDPEAVGDYRAQGYVGGPRTIYRDASRVEPGTITRIDARGTSTETYWDSIAIAEAAKGTFKGSEGDALAALDTLLGDAVRLRLVADVPLGVFLSGGIDSSLVTALMQRHSASPVRTFTIGFEDPEADESGPASRVARELGTTHTQFVVSAQDAREVIPLLPRMVDEPFADSSLIPTYLVSRMARAQVTVALSGDGGDELFGGYHRYFLGQRLEGRVARVPRTLRVPLGRALAAMPRRGLDLAAAVSPLRKLRGNLADRVAGFAGALTEGTQAPEAMMLDDFRGYLRDDILVKVDRASMAASLECREPLLDHRVVEFAWSLPLAWKVRDGEGKWLLRALLSKYLPPRLFEREKQGFGLPLGEWLRGPLREWAEPLLGCPSGWGDAAAVRTMWKEHLGGRDRQGALWRALMFEAWWAAHVRA